VGFDFGSLANATPAGAAASILSAAASTPASSGASSGPAALGPKVITIAGFGSKAGGSATQSLTQPEPVRADAFPSTPSGFAGLDVPAWVLPAVGLVLVLGIVGAVIRRK
jgi:hypothetical protein